MRKNITSEKFKDGIENFLKAKYWPQFTNGKQSIIIKHADMLDYDSEHSTQIYDALLSTPSTARQYAQEVAARLERDIP